MIDITTALVLMATSAIIGGVLAWLLVSWLLQLFIKGLTEEIDELEDTVADLELRNSNLRSGQPETRGL